MEIKKEFLPCKVAAWKKQTKTNADYFSLSIELSEEVAKKMLESKNFKISANIFSKQKTKETQPDFGTIDKEQQKT